jgi:hypothetical protein
MIVLPLPVQVQHAAECAADVISQPVQRLYRLQTQGSDMTHDNPE